VRTHFIAHGCPPPAPRPHFIRLDGPALIEGRCGVSGEAVELFDRAQANRGSVDLRTLRTWARVEELERLADELEHFDLASRDGTVVSIASGCENVVLADCGWRRWS
jgi:hypothetical protein